MISLARLEGFYWVARLEGYSKAARSFPYPITQPGVHQQVRRLEAELGVTLFERRGRDSVTLTAPGRALYDFVAPFYEGLRPLAQSLKEGSFGGQLRVHTTAMHLKQLVPQWFRRLHGKRPDIALDLMEVRRADLQPLLSGEIDLVIDYVPEVPKGLEARVVGVLHSFVVMPAEHPLAGREKVRLKDLGGEAFVAYNADLGGRALQLGALAEAGVSAGRLFGADSADAILGLVAAGLGVSIVPWHSESGPHLAGVKVYPLSGRRARFDVHAVWRRQKQGNALVEAALKVAPSPNPRPE